MSKINELFNKDLRVINMGLESFYNDLKKQEIPVTHVAWKPVAGGNKKLSSLLSRLK
ncbi:MAG: fdrA domain protein [Tissierellia bacterium]|nr:fdrA domain protein [Tissierellia bacterium]